MSLTMLHSEETSVFSIEFVRAIITICSSDILSECEHAIRVITKALVEFSW